MPRRGSGALALVLVLTGGLPLASCCASSHQASAKPAPPDPAEEVLAALTQALKLDAAQQQKTRELLKQMADRDDKMHASWAAGARIDPHAPLASRAQFDAEFLAILTPEQQRIFRETRLRYMIQTKFGRS
jgi:hypothetical protein